ncbi:MAG: hypothetical protein QW751_01650 [Candidatus Aenigmatarchaeota archaeon]|nr:hypothetical protein [Candidatus Aenigmarchaeota archaeon]
MKGIAIETVILLIIGLIVLVAGIIMLGRGQTSVSVSLSQSDLRNCCLNYCVTKDVSRTICSIPKSADKDTATTGINEPDGKASMIWLCNAAGVSNCAGFASQNCGCPS